MFPVVVRGDRGAAGAREDSCWSRGSAQPPRVPAEASASAAARRKPVSRRPVSSVGYNMRTGRRQLTKQSGAALSLPLQVGLSTCSELIESSRSSLPTA